MNEWWAVLKNDEPLTREQMNDEEFLAERDRKMREDRMNGISEYGGPLCEQCKEDAKNNPVDPRDKFVKPSFCSPREGQESISCRALAGMVPQSEHWKYAGVKPQWTQDWENMPMGKVNDLEGDAYDEYKDYEGHHDHTEWEEEQRGEQEAAQAKQEAWAALMAEAEEAGISVTPWEEKQQDHDALRETIDAVNASSQAHQRGNSRRRGTNRREYRKGEPMDMAWGLLKHA